MLSKRCGRVLPEPLFGGPIDIDFAPDAPPRVVRKTYIWGRRSKGRGDKDNEQKRGALLELGKMSDIFEYSGKNTPTCGATVLYAAQGQKARRYLLTGE